MDLIFRHHRAVATGMRAERAMTLVELLVVILIIAILVLVGLPAFMGQQNKAHDSAARQKLVTAVKAVRGELVFEHGKLPAPAQTGAFVGRLQSAEPSLTFEQGDSYPEDKIAVEINQDGGRKMILRTRSKSGNYFRYLLYDNGGEERQWASEVVSTTPAVNLFPFPSFELASLSVGYTQHNEYGTDKGLELTTDWASSGQKSLHWWGTGSGTSAVWVRFPSLSSAGSNQRPVVEPNKTYTVSLDLRVDVLPPKDPYLKIIWERGTITAGRSTEVIQIHEGVQRISLTATSPDATWASIEFGWDTGRDTSLGNNPFDIYFDSIRFSEGTETDYFDGSFPHSSWRGTPQQSPSEREGMDEQPADGQWRKW